MVTPQLSWSTCGGCGCRWFSFSGVLVSASDRDRWRLDHAVFDHTMRLTRLTVTKTSRRKTPRTPRSKSIQRASDVTLESLGSHNVEMILKLVAGLENKTSTYGKSKN